MMNINKKNLLPIFDEMYEKELITYIGGDVGSGGKTTSTGNVLAQEIESSLSGNLSCGNKNYNDYTLLSLQHNETQIFTKEIEILNGAQVLELTIQCNNGEFDTIGATENIVNTTCTTLGYIPYNNTCVENKCQNNPPLNATSTATSENHQVSWNYQETPGECSFECNTNYTYNSGSNTCEADTRNQTCSNITTNATYNTTSSINQIWNGTSWQPSNTSLHNVEPSNEECRFKCNSGFTYDIESNQCVGNNCITPTSGVHSGLMYSLASQSLTHGNSVTITSANRAFGTNPANGNTSANFTFSCNAGVISTLSTANNAGSCNSGHVFNNNYSSPGCTPNTYIVTFHGNGGTGFSPTTKTVVANTAIGTLPSPPTRNGYIFLGWSITESTLINSTITVYATWQEQPKYYGAPVYLGQSTGIFDGHNNWRGSVSGYAYSGYNAYPGTASISVKSTCAAGGTSAARTLGASYSQNSLQGKECSEDGVWYVLSAPTNCCFITSVGPVQCNFTAKIYKMPCQ